MLYTIIMELGHGYNYIEISCFRWGYKFLWDDDDTDDNITVEKSLSLYHAKSQACVSTQIGGVVFSDCLIHVVSLSDTFPTSFTLIYSCKRTVSLCVLVWEI